MKKDPISSDIPPISEKPPSKSSHKGGYLLVAISTILMIGSLVAAGLLYSQLGYASLAIGGGGVVVSGALLLISKCCCFPKETTENKKRSNVFRETLNACSSDGYQFEGKKVVINSMPLRKNVETYKDCKKLGTMSNPYQTKFSVALEDTLNVLVKLSKEGKNPVGINMANRYQAGGGVQKGARGQEEDICLRSNLILGLGLEEYPFPELGGIYCPHVKVFREDEAHGFAFMEQPQDVALVAVAAYDLNWGSKDRERLGLSLSGSANENMLKSSEYRKNTKEKIRNMLREMAIKGHTHIVLGALGCGAFQTPPCVMATCFMKVFQEAEFKGRFEEVQFAILTQSAEEQNTKVQPFRYLCNELNDTKKCSELNDTKK